jgi:hypothetical protein
VSSSTVKVNNAVEQSANMVALNLKPTSVAAGQGNHFRTGLGT